MREVLALFLALSCCSSEKPADFENSKPVARESLADVVSKEDVKKDVKPFSLEPAYELLPAADGFYYHTKVPERIDNTIVFFLNTSFYLNGEEVYTSEDFLSEPTLTRNHHYPIKDFIFPKPVDEFDEVRLKIGINGIETVDVGLDYDNYQNLLKQGRVDRFFVIKDVKAPPMINVVKP